MNRPTKNQLIKVVKSKPWFVQGFNGLPLYLHNVAANTGWMTKKHFGANYSHFFLEMHESRARWYYDETDMANVGYGYYKKIKNIGQLKTLEAQHKKEYLKARKTAGITKPENLKKLSFKELVTLAQKMITELTMSVSFAHAQEGISFVSEMKLKEILNKRTANTHENFQLLSSPTKKSFLGEAQTLLWHIRRSSGTKREKLINKFLKDFSWIDNSYVRGKTISKADVLEKAKHQKDMPSEIALGQTKTQKQKLVKELQLTKQELFVVQTIETTTSWQDTRKKFIMQTIGRFEPVVVELSQRLGMPADHFKYICPKEVTLKNLTSKTFHWIYNDYAIVRNLGPEHFLREIRNLLLSPKNIKIEQHALAHVKKITAAKSALFKKHRFSPQEKEKIKAMVLIANWRDSRKTFNQMANAVLHRYAKEFAKRLSLPLSKVENVFWWEAQTLFLNHKKMAAAAAKRSAPFFILEKPDNENKILYGSAATKLNHFLTIIISKDRKLFGKPAYVGTVTGIVKIVRNQKEFVKMKPGDVLVAANTRPEYVPIMKIAGAIVTEEGGITSHAAIVSRELKIPCIVGVQGVLAKLRTGDTVEVDAINGIIKVIKKAK